MAISTDLHMHTLFSYDSKASPESMIRESMEKGLKYICFTDHYDKDYFYNDCEAVFSIEDYFNYMLELKERYADKIDIKIGIELGLQPHLCEEYNSLAEYPFDMIIGSVHCLNGVDPYAGKLFMGKSDSEVYRLMFEETLRNISCYSNFDTLGHLDYAVRYSNEKGRDYSYEAYSEYIDEILRLLIDRGCGLEINTGGLKYGLSFAHPVIGALKKYKSLGGEIVTIGADAHIPGHIGYRFDVAEEMLKECGFEYYTVFDKRKPCFIKI